MKNTELTIITLKRHKRQLTRQQFRTLCGQAKSGDCDGAIKGLMTIVGRRLATDGRD